MVQFLKEELNHRLSKNPQYSLRSFARSLGVNVGTLSSLLNGKRKLSLKTAQQFCEMLSLNPSQIQIALDQLENENEWQILKPKKDIVYIEQEHFSAISDWFHYGILQLIRTSNYKDKKLGTNYKWFAKELGITQLQAKTAIKRLTDLDYICLNSNGQLARNKKSLNTANPQTTRAALKSLQRQLREKAIQSLEDFPIEERVMTSMTMAIKPSKIEAARLLINDFQDKLSQFLEADGQESVYQMTISLFPISKQGMKNEIN